MADQTTGGPGDGQPRLGTVSEGAVKRSTGCAFLAVPLLILLGLITIAFAVAIPGSVVATVLVEMARHGSGPLKNDAWVHGSLWKAFSGPVCTFGVSIYGLIECLDAWPTKSKSSGRAAKAQPTAQQPNPDGQQTQFVQIAEPGQLPPQQTPQQWSQPPQNQQNQQNPYQEPWGQ